MRTHLKGVPALLVHLVGREQGIIVMPGNPKQITTFADLAREGVTFINRQRGSGTRVLLDQEQGNLLNSYGVITTINRNGYKTWGNNTAAYPTTTDPKDRWLAVRRMFTWWSNTLILTYFQRVDDPMNLRLIENIEHPSTASTDPVMIPSELVEGESLGAVGA